MAAEQTKLYQTNHTGMLSAAVVGTVLYGRVPDYPGILNSSSDPTKGPNSPHYEIIFGGGYVESVPNLPVPEANFVSINVVLITSNSTGSVTIATSNAWDAPILNTNFLSSQYDLYVLTEAIKLVKSIGASPAMDGYIYGEYGAFGAANTDEEITEYIKNYAVPNWHASGSAAMGKKGTKAGVVNPDLTVKGASNLRVVDASIFPFLPSSHLQAPTYAVAERAADLIKAAHAH